MEVSEYTLTSNFQSGLDVTKYMDKNGLEDFKTPCHVKNIINRVRRSQSKRKQSWGRFIGENCAGRHTLSRRMYQSYYLLTPSKQRQALGIPFRMLNMHHHWEI